MDIGTAKPSRESRQRVPHHLVDVADPDERYSAARFQTEADRAIEEIQRRGKNVLVVAGTGLYLRALTRGLFRGPAEDPNLRERLRRDVDARGSEALHERLAEVDPGAARRIHPRDAFRIVRAMEVYLGTGVPISRHQENHGFARERYRTLHLGLHVERPVLCGRIDARVEEMMARGLLDEVRGLMARGYSLDLPSMGSLGYRHMGQHLTGEVTLEEAVLLMKRDTRRFARRQMTWFRSMEAVRWFEPFEGAAILRGIYEFLRESGQRP
jgi:tRNA dimethylallyltransferase